MHPATVSAATGRDGMAPGPAPCALPPAATTRDGGPTGATVPQRAGVQLGIEAAPHDRGAAVTDVPHLSLGCRCGVWVRTGAIGQLRGYDAHGRPPLVGSV